MFMNRRTVRIEWGDCDPAGIVFYPRYMAMFDHSTVVLLEAALGLNKYQLYEKYDFDGYPMVETRARGDAATLAAEAARAGVPLVVAVGGDGTLNEVINGLLPLRAEYPVTVGALMTGRGRDACRKTAR